jgi:hypothetical protein
VSVASVPVQHDMPPVVEDAQPLAAHADARTTRLYMRKNRKVSRVEVERGQL